MIKTYEDINWPFLRENAMERKGWKNKTPKDWDKKARSFSGRNKHNSYIDLFLSHIPFDNNSTVLDIGSGPGTLAIPLARKAGAVTAVDFSKGMLDTLEELAGQEGLTNITTHQCAWEDDWQQAGIGMHDIAVASRSMGVKDLEAALLKINSFAAKYVFISDRIGPTPFEAAAFKAIGRTFQTGPDYIYTLNTLYTLGIHPNVTVIELDRYSRYASHEDAFQSFSWMFQDLTPQEEDALRLYITSRIRSEDETGFTVERETPVRWALIWWKKK